MAIDKKYGRVDLEHGDIGEDEAIIVFRAQDLTVPELLDRYSELCAAKGSPQHHLDAISDAKAHIKAWQATHPTKIPQSASYVREA